MISNHDVGPAGPGNPGRRRFLGHTLFGAVAVNLGLAWVQPSAADAVVASTVPARFLEVSQALCGRGHLEPGLALRLYRALLANRPDLPAHLDQLSAFMGQPGHDIGGLQAALDSAGVPYASLPRALVGAWYTGVVGDGEHAHCVAYEEALMNVTVADQLKPPSYAYGNYGSWAAQPATA